MTATPNPQPYADYISVDAIDKGMKKFNCLYYEQCLEVAQGWPQFHCLDCRAFAEIPEDSPQQVKLVKLGKTMIQMMRARAQSVDATRVRDPLHDDAEDEDEDPADRSDPAERA